MVFDTLASTAQTIFHNAMSDVFSVLSPAYAQSPVTVPGQGSTSGNNGSMWQTFGDTIVSIFYGIRPFVIALVTVALIVEAIGCIIGGEQSRERFKHALPWVIGSAVLIMIAMTVATGLVDNAAADSDWT